MIIVASSFTKSFVFVAVIVDSKPNPGNILNLSA